jgi:hypothetical protein
MAKWAASLVLIIVLTGSALAGIPMHSSENSCPLMGMDDCCKTAQSQSATPQVYAARLCCSLNCSLPGTTGSIGIEPKTPTLALALHNTPNTPASFVMTMRRGLFAHTSPERTEHSPPIYLQHLAFLI